jgi:hypothetical protein
MFLKNLDLSKIKSHNKRLQNNHTRNQITPFPLKLYRMLEEVENQGNEHIVSWHPDGRSFHVHNTEKFVEVVLPHHFKQTKYKSFQRQLNFYGFQRITSGPLEGSYGHTNFIRGNEELCKVIKRQTNHAEHSHEQRIGLPDSIRSGVDMTAASDDDASTSESPPLDIEIDIPVEIQVVEKQAPAPRRDSFLFAVEDFAALDSKRRGSIREDTRLSFVGKKFFFLPVEFTDLYGV